MPDLYNVGTAPVVQGFGDALAERTDGIANLRVRESPEAPMGVYIGQDKYSRRTSTGL